MFGKGAWFRSRVRLRNFDDIAYVTIRGVCLHDFYHLETIKRAYGSDLIKQISPDLGTPVCDKM